MARDLLKENGNNDSLCIYLFVAVIYCKYFLKSQEQTKKKKIIFRYFLNIIFLFCQPVSPVHWTPEVFLKIYLEKHLCAIFFWLFK